MCGVCGRVQSGWYDRKLRQIRDFPSGDMRIYLELEIRRIDCRSCQGVKQEKLDWLADNPFYTKRFAFYIGRRCRSSSIQDVAKEHLLAVPAMSRHGRSSFTSAPKSRYIRTLPRLRAGGVEAGMEDPIDINRRNWDERAKIHVDIAARQ
jgi:transposase